MRRGKKERSIRIQFGDDHVTYAVIVPEGRGRYYATGEHFGMHLFDDQHESDPSFDDTSPIRWEYRS